MNEKFILLCKEKELLKYCDTYIFDSIPKSKITLRIKLTDEIYKMIENTIRANVNKGNIRMKYINEIKVNIMMLDFYMDLIYEKEIIIKKRFLSTTKKLCEINKIVNGLALSYEKK